jgi:hypothetical protein
MAVYANLSLDQGSDFSSTIFVTDNAGDEMDLTNFTHRGQVRKSYSSTTSVNFATLTLAPVNGQIQMNLTGAQTLAMKHGRYVYDVEVISASGVTTRVVEGQLEVTPSVSR